MRVILDANFLIDMIKFKIPLEEIHELLSHDAEIFTLNSVLEELKRIAGKSGKDARYAKAALKLIESKKIGILSSEKRTDEALLFFADQSTIIATNDKSLRKKLRKKGVKSIFIRAKKRLDFC
jgi:rRNA-processing protein FCF1